MSDTTVETKRIEIENKPHINVTKYEYHHLYKLYDGDYKVDYARLNIRMYLGDTIIH